MMPGADISTVARVLNVTPQRVGQLAREAGFPPKIGRNEYDLQKITLWYIRHLQAELKRRGPAATAEGASMQAEKLGLTAAQRVKAETENRVRRGELLERDAVRDVLTQRLANCRQRLRAIPTTLGPQLTNKSDPAYIVDRMKNDIDLALTELSGGYEGGREPVADGADSTSAAADVHGESMGGREAATIE
jgi:phage terminase Nu1 subunit (DNA packaging protein)